MKKSNKNNKETTNKHEKQSTYTVETKKKKKGYFKRHPKFALFLKIMIVLILLLIVIVAGAIVALIGSDNWELTSEDLNSKSVDTIICDKDGNEIANVSGIEKRRNATLEEVPKNLQNAYISIEDERFDTHKGVDLKRTLGATVNYIIKRGNSSYGGSTITQQLIKNLKYDDDDSGIAGIQRKIREISRAYKLEKWLSKDQILELYLNTIFVGSDVYGVKLGSIYYFNKSVSDLDLAECAFLAGINHSPNNYNPFGEKDNSEKIKTRTKTVLVKMKELGKITTEEYNNAVIEVDAGLHFEKGNTSSGSSMSYLAQAAYNQVIKQYAEENNISQTQAKTKISGGGYKIYTTQDSSIQATAESVYRSGDHIFKGVAKKDGVLVNEGHTQSAMVIIDHKTGYVVGCMGGLGDDVNANGQNRATQSERQPGSAIKPIASIAPALESGIITASTIYDESRTYFSGGYTPTNSGKGLITVRKAIQISANTTEVKIMTELGPKNSIDFMRKMGISSLVTASENSAHNDENLALVLGGVTNGITPLEMAGAYATIANDGVYITPTFYTKMEDASGKVILEAKQEKNRVMSEANAYILKSILTGPVSSGGTATSAKISGQETAGKTGTTNDNYDRWFCGFTNYYTAATWYGFDMNETINYEGKNPAGLLWSAVMKDIHSNLKGTTFEMPSGVKTATICSETGMVATDSCPKTYTEYYLFGTIPGKCTEHKGNSATINDSKNTTQKQQNTQVEEKNKTVENTVNSTKTNTVQENKKTENKTNTNSKNTKNTNKNTNTNSNISNNINTQNTSKNTTSENINKQNTSNIIERNE